MQVRRADHEPPLGAVLARLTIGNPLRLAGRQNFEVRSGRDYPAK